MPEKHRLHTALFRGEDCRACGGAPLLVAALVPRHPGPGSRGNSLHYYHIPPEVVAYAG